MKHKQSNASWIGKKKSVYTNSLQCKCKPKAEENTYLTNVLKNKKGYLIDFGVVFWFNFLVSLSEFEGEIECFLLLEISIDALEVLLGLSGGKSSLFWARFVSFWGVRNTDSFVLNDSFELGVEKSDNKGEGRGMEDLDVVGLGNVGRCGDFALLLVGDEVVLEVEGMEGLGGG